MGDAVALDDAERLPWLTETPPPERQARGRTGPFLMLLATIILAALLALAIWWAIERGPTLLARFQPTSVQPARPVAPAPQSPRPPIEHRQAPAAEPAPRSTAPPALPKAPVESPPKQKPAPAAPTSETQAALTPRPGRLVQAGALASQSQAEREWQRLSNAHPYLKPLRHRIVRSRVNGQIYYRLQLGTFSRNQSELLCGRLRESGERCFVVGSGEFGERE